MQAATLEQDVHGTDVSPSDQRSANIKAEAQALLAEGVLDETQALSWFHAVDWRYYIDCMERANE